MLIYKIKNIFKYIKFKYKVIIDVLEKPKK